MLDPRRLSHQSGRFGCAVILAFLFIYSSCTPTPIASKVNSDDISGDSNNQQYPNPTFPLDGTFVQEGAVRTKTSFSLPVDFNDSFMIRGDSLSTYLKGLPVSTKFCLVGKFNYISGTDKFLILTAKPKLYTDLVNKTSEYYLSVEPSNDAANQNDCLVYNLTNALFTGASNPSASFSLTQLCSNCSNAVTSTGLRLYFINGEEVPTITTSSLTLSISGSINGNTGNSCSSSSACTARGYDCCLNSQCVNDGAIKPGAINMSGFDSAQEDVRINPDRYVVYPQYYFVCEENTGTTTGTTGGGEEEPDPDYVAQIELLKKQHLYECINKIDGEFSYCTVKVADASESIPGTFPTSADGKVDDINFSTLNSALGSGDRANNIVRIRYAGQVIYQQNSVAISGGTLSSANDNLTSYQTVAMTAALPTNAPDDDLYITYKTDGTCTKMGSSLAKCTKTYIQSSSDTSLTTYHNSTKTYLLPSYADTSSTASLIVKIGGLTVAEDSTTWTKAQSPNRIIFNSSYPIYQNQTIEITYYVNNSANVAALTAMRTAAMASVNAQCGYTSGGNLKPKYDGENLIDYECVPPSSTTETDPPSNQTVLVSGKNVPHRYYDVNGVSYDSDYSTAPDQELNAFSYTNGSVTQPNNVSAYVGFNEIYGSFAKTSSSSARPAKMARVKSGRSYDILVTSGSFATCSTCGNDYYSALQKIFPQNFSGQGGGYRPDYYESRKENATGTYRSDDLLYGRACFVPATMIPWTHVQGTDAKTQRQSRLTAQHFLFANGYNRDWYGFDYGSLIGSFDGVKWFSIGNQRRITATSNKLYLAVNAYFGDLTVDNAFNVNITETSSATTATIPTHDTQTDGAECQRAHFCSTDNDCYRTLGYDYTCQNISGLTTSWPTFDANGAEVIGTSTKTLASLVGGTNSQPKRCVYRGRGAPCETNLASLSSSFNGSTLIGNAACSANNYCQAISSSRFNDRIARFATTPAAQNAVGAASTNSDIVGLGARIIGRPFDYYGTKSAPGTSAATLASNAVDAICVPGKSISGSTTWDLNNRAPSSRTDSSDRIIGAGVTMSSTNTNYYNACTATDNAGVNIQQYQLSLGDAALNQMTISQNLSTNLLNLAPLTAQNIYSTTSGSTTTATGYQRNACLRAPGASCFSDLDCGPSQFAATKAKAADLSALLVSAEEKFWEEELVCGNPDFKYVSTGVLNPSFDVRKNLCCRENGNIMTTFTQMPGDPTSPLWCDTTNEVPLIAGVNQSISTKRRYSKVHTAYDKMTCDPDAVTSAHPYGLSVDATSTSNAFKQILYQYKTLDTVNSRTCCTSHWVRSFASDNGGGHAFARTKMQTIDKTMWKHISWAPQNTTLGITDGAFECDPDNYTNSSCEVKSLTSAEQTKYLTWAGTLELIGIPQVAVMTNDQIYKLVNDNQEAIGAGVPLDNSINAVTPATEDFNDGTYSYYSAASYDNFDMSTLKKVFSENEFNCCIPSGQQLPDTTTAAQCCTGFAASSGVKRCCLPDYTDVTVYLNRYVSSEGRGLPESAYDPKTGYIKDAGQVLALVNSKNLCCSGKAMTGVAISQLSIPLLNNTYPLPATLTSTSKRFNYRTDDIDNNAETGSIGSWFDAGVRWNNHVYCVP